MRILQRYIFVQLLLPFLISFFTLSFIFMAGYLVKAANFIIGRGVPLTDTLYILALALPDMISYTVPMAILTAVMIVFGSLSQNNEIRAVKASGVHPLFVMGPAFIVGIVLSLVMFVFNDQVANNTAFELRKATKKLLIKHPKAVIEPGRFVKLSDQIIFHTKEMRGDEMYDIVAYEVERDDKPIRTIIAERGEIQSNADQSSVKVVLYNGSVSDSEEKEVQSIQFKTYEFPALFKDDVKNMRKKLKDLSLAELLLRKEEEDFPPEEMVELWTAFHQRISFAFGSFIFVFLGMPIAILVRRGEIVVSFAISMTAASLYYVLFVGAKTIAISGLIIPVVALWLPNILLIGAGFYLMRRAVFS